MGQDKSIVICGVQQETTVVVGMFRYYLGRQTYAVSDCVELLIHWWAKLSDKTKALLRKELETAIAKDNEARERGSSCCPLGMDMDRREWLRLYDVMRTHAEPMEGDRCD